MTLHCWNHWFWITTITLIFALKLNCTFTHPINPIEEIKEYNNKNLPLKYPISSQDDSDHDDVYMGQEIIPSQSQLINKIIDRNANFDQNKILFKNNNKTIEDNLILNKNQSNFNKNNDLNNISDVIKLVPDANFGDKLKSSNDTIKITKNLNQITEKLETDNINLNHNLSNFNFSLNNKTQLNESANNSKSNIMQIKKNYNINSTILSSKLSLQSRISDENNDSTTTSIIIFDNSTASYDDDDIGNITKLDLITTTNNSILNDNSTDVADEEKISTKLESVTKVINADNIELDYVRKSKVLLSEYRDGSRSINFPTETKNLLTRSAVDANSADMQLYNEQNDDGNVSSEALQITGIVMDAGTISGICFAVFALCISVSMIGIILYRRRFLNKPQTLNEPDSSVYIDDSTIRDNSDEMYSLDNDSFLNSLEAMTIQNYWTDTVKHTKL